MVAMRQGSVPYPTSIDAGPIRAFAESLETIAQRFDVVDDTLDRAAITARQTWQGTAADTFGNHMNDRGHVFELAAERVREATPTLMELADTIEHWTRAYDVAVQHEESANSRGSLPDRDAAMLAQEVAVRRTQSASDNCSTKLAAIAALLGGYTNRSFIAIGDNSGPCFVVDSTLQGRDLLLDSLQATEDGRISPDEIQIREMDDGSYVVVLPGVTDLTSNLPTPWRWVTGGPEDRARMTANAKDSAVYGGPNPYAEAVKIALQRAGVPPGSDVTFVGHSYGDYTAVDLASDDDFNSADGTSRGYNVKVRRVFGFGADVGWKLKNVPAETDVVAVNSRNDQVYQAERTFHPPLMRDPIGDREQFSPSVPWYRPVVSRPSKRKNQVVVEINGGVQWTGDDGVISGHHPRNYVRSIPKVGDDVTALYERMGSARVRQITNVRVPAGPKDTVPDVP
jgi:hypothetical protein